MLKVISLSLRSQTSEIFKSFDAQNQSWLVSDLRTKFELQQKILQRDGQFRDESVYRASELWKLLLKRIDPSVRIVSDSFARSLLRGILDEHEETLSVNAAAEDTIFSYIDQLAPIIFHPQGTQRLDEWFSENPESESRWKVWYLRAKFCASKLLQDHGVLTADWVTAYLQEFQDFSKVWNFPLIVDLGGEITKVEAELLIQISKSVDVTILEPAPQWRNEFRYLLTPYEDLKTHSQKIEKIEMAPVPKVLEQGLRFSGMLAEVKNAVGQVRQWLEQGASATEIAIVAPDIETYWPVLQPFLEEEGIPSQKDITHKIQALPSVIRWVSFLRTLSGRLSSSDLEIAFYQQQKSDPLRHEQFKALFQSLYDVQDLSRHEAVQKLFSGQIDIRGHLKRDEFVAKAISYWKSEELDSVQVVLRELLQNAISSTSMRWSDWLLYLETILSAKEFVLQKGKSEGILVTKLMSAASEKIKYRIFLGLSEESFRSKNKTQLDGDDLFKLGSETGFYLDNPDQSDLEFELQLLADSESHTDLYCFGASDFLGKLLSPAKFWMKKSANQEEAQLPLETRWDQMQYSDSAAWRAPVAYNREVLLHRIEQDLGLLEFDKIQIEWKPRISASALETYLDCPFKFAAQRFFNLEDPAVIDLDLDRRTSGRLAHGLFETLLSDENLLATGQLKNWSDQELLAVLESVREKEKLVLADERLWLSLKGKYLSLAKRFINFESELRKDLPRLKTLAREKKFHFYLNPKDRTSTVEKDETFYRISGSIDRIDSDGQGHISVIDYKSSSGQAFSHGSWIKNNKIQLLLYAWALEKGLVENVKGEVVALLYYVFKKFELKGFKLEEQVGTVFRAGKKVDKDGNIEVKQEYITEFENLLFDKLAEIQEGLIPARPADLKICDNCKWRVQCRAPHLN